MRKQEDYYDYVYSGIKDRKPMSNEARAAQFNAFDALTGFGTVIEEAGMIGDERIESQNKLLNSIVYCFDGVF